MVINLSGKWTLACEEFDDDVQRVEYIRSGVIANNTVSGNAIEILLHKNYNGSGREHFGGAKSWPCITVRVGLPTGRDDLQEKFAEGLAAAVDTLITDLHVGAL